MKFDALIFRPRVMSGTRIMGLAGLGACGVAQVGAGRGLARVNDGKGSIVGGVQLGWELVDRVGIRRNGFVFARGSGGDHLMAM